MSIVNVRPVPRLLALRVGRQTSAGVEGPPSSNASSPASPFTKPCLSNHLGRAQRADVAPRPTPDRSSDRQHAVAQDAQHHPSDHVPPDQALDVERDVTVVATPDSQTRWRSTTFAPKATTGIVVRKI